MKKRKNRFLVDFPKGVTIEDVVKFCLCMGKAGEYRAHIDLQGEEYPLIKFVKRKEQENEKDTDNI